MTIAAAKSLIMRQEHAGVYEDLEKVLQLTGHWNAGDPDDASDHYHISALRKALKVAQTLSTRWKGSHCWGRNTHNVGVALGYLGPASGPPPADQVTMFAKVFAWLAGMFGIVVPVAGLDFSTPDVVRLNKLILPPDRYAECGVLVLPKMASNDTSIWRVPGTILAPSIADHAFFAHRDGYYPDRWDMGDMWADIMDEVRFWRAETVAGRCTNDLLGVIN